MLTKAKRSNLKGVTFTLSKVKFMSRKNAKICLFIMPSYNYKK